MPSYRELGRILKGATTGFGGTHFDQIVVPYLLSVWLDDYRQWARSSEIVQTSVDCFSYLFDIDFERLVAAWGVSTGRHSGVRDRSRMAGHPLSVGRAYHRGHGIAHTLGGGMDINLVPQLGSLNTGRFRMLEREAVASPGAFYFSYWRYLGSRRQKPRGVEQG
jgi:hypothetical protein